MKDIIPVIQPIFVLHNPNEGHIYCYPPDFVLHNPDDGYFSCYSKLEKIEDVTKFFPF
jgi:hypothetical protein